MRRPRFVTVSAAALLFATIPVTAAAQAPAGPVAHPPIHVKPAATTSAQGYSPSQIRSAYGFDLFNQSGVGQVVGIVDAFDDPTAASDLETFIMSFRIAQMYGLPGQTACTVAAGPHPCFQKVFAQNNARTNDSWALEISLDVQWAHAIAPGADILLVESRDNRLGNLLGAVITAANDGAHAVSMSWGASEFLGENNYDSYFSHTGVTFVAASGDNGNGILWPAVAPDVVGAGGTTLPFICPSGQTSCAPINGTANPSGEAAWSGSGGGISAYESEPGYQSGYATTNTTYGAALATTGGKRGVPDVAFDADPNTGVSVYDSTPYNGQTGWWQVGGTSAAAPQWAGLIALADQMHATSLSSNNLASSPEYNAAATAVYTTNYRDIASGSNGTCGSVCMAGTGYDFVTGLGSPQANNLVTSAAFQ
jgi:subtilase family serine protease